MKKSGLRGLSTRRIAKKMGYTPGTLYQLFADLDDLVLQLNAKTLDELYEKCREVDFSREPEAVLKELADKYMEFVGAAPRLWSAIFEHSLPERHNLPSSYGDRVRNLLSLAEKALLPLFPADPQRRLHEAHVLWAGLYGITSLADAHKLSEIEDPRTMVESLIRNYVTGLRANT